jgi:multiple sugar transport system ATP-binding protein
VSRVVIEHLTKSFPAPDRKTIPAVEDLSFTVESGELFVLVGPSGCGKTSTLRLIAGLETSDHGTITVDGELANDVPPQKRDVAMVFQNHALYPHMTGRENLMFGLKLRKVPEPEIEKRVDEIAELLHLRDCLERLPMELSGGERQRVALGRAFVRHPKVLLLDEPLSNLDTPLRQELRLKIAELHARLGSTMIYVTHDQGEAMSLGNRLAVMRNGVLQQIAEPQVLYEKPDNRFVAGFFGAPPMNFFRGIVEEQEGSWSFREQVADAGQKARGFVLPLEAQSAASLRPYVGKPVIIGIRPEHIALARNATEPNQQAIRATTQFIERTGADALLHSQTAVHPFIAKVSRSALAQVGEELLFSFDLRQACFFDPQTKKRIE